MSNIGSDPCFDANHGDLGNSSLRCDLQARLHRRRLSLQNRAIFVGALLLGGAIGYLVQTIQPSVVFDHDAPDRPRRALGTEVSAYVDIIGRPAKNFSDEIRVRLDPARGRLWRLELDHVIVYDTQRRVELHRIALPAWPVADFVCAPDLVLDAKGHAFVSNNVQPIIMQIDLEAVRVSEHRLETVSARQAEIGFGTLKFTPDGALLGVSALGRSLWRIDLAARSAEQIADASDLDDCDAERSQWAESRLAR